MIPVKRRTAFVPNLVEIVETENGKPGFLLLNEQSEDPLRVVANVEVKESIFIPPKPESMRWLLPRAVRVKYHYINDTDQALYYDLVAYHQNISQLPSVDHYHLLAVWDFHTYLYEKAEYSPIIWLYAVPERGKTRTGKACAYVARRALHVESLRDAYLVRISENLGATLFIDVMNLWGKAQKNSTEDVLLLRYEAGATVRRVLYPDRGPHEDTVYYSVYGPTIVATNEVVSQIFATRAIQIVMPESDRDFENDVRPEDGLELKERLTAFRARHLNEPLPAASKPCRGRLGDIVRPLRQIVKLVAPGEEERFLRLCGQLQQERGEDLADTVEGEIIQAIVDLQHEIKNGLLKANRIHRMVNSDRPLRFCRAQTTITRTCKRLGFRTRRPGGSTHIEVDLNLLERLAARYLQSESETTHTRRFSAQSAQSANTEEKQALRLCSFIGECAQDLENRTGEQDASEERVIRFRVIEPGAGKLVRIDED